MIKDSLNSIFDNLKERTTNPFLGTFIVVWIVHNWTLVYSFFNFDTDYSLLHRIEFVEKYFVGKSFIGNLLFVAGVTILVLLFTYLMLTVSRLITDTQEKVVLPLISKLTDGSSVVMKADYIILQEALRAQEERLQKERSIRFTTEDERDKAERKVEELRESLLKALNSTAREEPSENRSSRAVNTEDNSREDAFEEYRSGTFSGTVTFNYSDNNGSFQIGQGKYSFDLRWSKASNRSIYIYSPTSTVKSIAIAKDVTDMRLIEDASIYNTTSSTRNPKLNDIIVAQNFDGYYAAIQIKDIKDDSRGAPNDELTFDFIIQTNGTANFKNIEPSES